MLKIIGFIVASFVVIIFLLGIVGMSTNPTSRSSSVSTEIHDVSTKNMLRDLLKGTGATCPEVIQAYDKSLFSDQKYKFKVYCGIDGKARSNIIYTVTGHFDNTATVKRSSLYGN